MPTRRLPEQTQDASSSSLATNGPLRPLLPKRGWQPLSKPMQMRSHRKLSPTQARHVRICRVPACKLPNCTLRTHQQYARKAAAPSGSSPATSTTSSLNHEPTTGTDNASQNGPQMVAWKALDFVPRNAFHGLEQLPDTLGETPVFRTLFHEFFSRIYDRIMIVVAPPPVNHTAKLACFNLAMTSPAYCLNAIASVEIKAMLGRKATGQDQTITVLYGKVMSILRAQVKQLETAELDNLLMIICTLALFDVVHQNFSTLAFHRQGMIQLVNRVGGVHNLGISLPIVLHLDRIFATFTGDLPAYARLIDASIQRPSKYPEVYAASFNKQLQTHIDQEVCTFCCDVSRVLELFENANISFDPKTASKTANADVLYFYFSRQRVSDHFAFLNHKYWGLHSKSKCVLLAAKILDYKILLDNYISTTQEFLASKCKETLEMLEAESAHNWKGQENLLIWILFVLITMPQPPSAYGWIVKRLRNLLITKYNGFSIASDWKEEELRSMNRFVWCSSRLDEIFLKICQQLERSDSVIDGVVYDNGINDIADSESDTQ